MWVELSQAIAAYLSARSNVPTCWSDIWGPWRAGRRRPDSKVNSIMAAELHLLLSQDYAVSPVRKIAAPGQAAIRQPAMLATKPYASVMQKGQCGGH